MRAVGAEVGEILAEKAAGSAILRRRTHPRRTPRTGNNPTTYADPSGLMRPPIDDSATVTTPAPSGGSAGGQTDAERIRAEHPERFNPVKTNNAGYLAIGNGGAPHADCHLWGCIAAITLDIITLLPIPGAGLVGGAFRAVGAEVGEILAEKAAGSAILKKVITRRATTQTGGHAATAELSKIVPATGPSTAAEAGFTRFLR